MEIKTRRLVLRELLEADAEQANRYERDPEVVRYQSNDVQTLEGSLEYVRKSLASASENPRATFDLAVTLDGVFIGRVGLKVDSFEHKQGTLWYVLDPAHQRRGYVTEAAAALLDFGFGELGLHRVYVDCDPRNLASIRIAEKLGMRREGQLRESYWLKGEWCDAVILSILAEEWRARIR